MLVSFIEQREGGEEVKLKKGDKLLQTFPGSSQTVERMC